MSENENMVKLTIDGREITVPAGTMILEAARSAGIDIPHFCYHPQLSLSGSCRMCFVEIEKVPKLVTSCCTPVAEGMAVSTGTPKVIEGRRSVLEFLLLNHPVDCPVCDQAGECKLQDYFIAHGLYDSRVELVEKVHKAKVIRLGDEIVLDRERCVLCVRCVRFCSEVTGSNALQLQQRGHKAEIATFRDEPIDDDYSGCLADICPVGALTSAKFRFQCRVWFLEGTDSICDGCSTGCNIRIEHYRGHIKRFLPRENPAVNSTWLCNEGRWSWRALHDTTDRVTSPMILTNGALREATWHEALTALGRLAHDASGSISGISSPRMSNEELFLFRKYIMETAGGACVDFRIDDSHALMAEMQDNLLRRRDKNPNTRGALLFGIAGDDIPLAAVRTALVVAFRQNIAKTAPELLDAIRARGAKLVLFTSKLDETAREADIVLPIAEYFETDGTFTNYEGRVQGFFKAVEAPGETREARPLLASLCGCPSSARDVRAVMRSECSAFAGFDESLLSPKGWLMDD